MNGQSPVYVASKNGNLRVISFTIYKTIKLDFGISTRLQGKPLSIKPSMILLLILFKG